MSLITKPTNIPVTHEFLKTGKLIAANNSLGFDIIKVYDHSCSYPYRCMYTSSGYNIQEKYFKSDDIYSNGYKVDISVIFTNSRDGISSVVVYSSVLPAGCATHTFKEPISTGPYCFKSILSAVDAITTEVKLQEEQKEAITQKGREMKPDYHILKDSEISEDFAYADDGQTIGERYGSIVGTISKLTSELNSATALGDNKELVEAFNNAKLQIQQYTSTATAGSAKGFIGRLIGDNKYAKRVIAKVKKTKAENDSIQKNIDYLFGLIQEKYECLVTSGEGLQAAKSQIAKQLEALSVLHKESSEFIGSFADRSQIPIRDLSLNTQIEASIEKYKNRLAKIDGAIIAAQTTIMALGKDLPSMKSDLTDETAISGLLSSIDDYQQMYDKAAELVSDVTETVAKQSYDVIENLFDMQIKDNRMISYLENSSKRSQKFATMVADRSDQLATKIRNDADKMLHIAAHNSSNLIAQGIQKLQ